MPMDQLNLIPKPIRARRLVKQRMRRWCVGACAYGILLTGCVLVLTATVSGESPDVSQRDLLAIRIQEKQEALELRRREITNERRRLDTQKKMVIRVAWSQLLELVGFELGDEIVLESATLEPQEKSTEEIAGLRIRGIAQSQDAVSALIQRLQETGVFRRIDLVGTRRKMHMGFNRIGFELECTFESEPAATGAKP